MSVPVLIMCAVGVAGSNMHHLQFLLQSGVGRFNLLPYVLSMRLAILAAVHTYSATGHGRWKIVVVIKNKNWQILWPTLGDRSPCQLL